MNVSTTLLALAAAAVNDAEFGNPQCEGFSKTHSSVLFMSVMPYPNSPLFLVRFFGRSIIALMLEYYSLFF